MSKPTLAQYLAEVRERCKVQTSACRTRTDVEVLVGMVEAFLTYLEETDGEWHPLNNLHNKLDTLIPPASAEATADKSAEEEKP